MYDKIINQSHSCCRNDWSLEPSYLKRTNCTNSPRQERVPMVWSWYPKSNITGRIPNTSPYLLGFNEPNHKGQANLTPLKAANAWRLVEKAAGNNVILVTPSAAPCGDPNKCLGNTIEWFDSFFRLCEGCRFDYMATHHYSCNPSATMTFLRQLHERYGLPIWLTEFSCPRTTSVARILNYMKGVLPRLEAAPFVFRYSWFVSRSTRGADSFVTSATSLLEPHSSTLTQLGRYYNNYTP